jgi:competence protein ComEA
MGGAFVTFGDRIAVAALATALAAVGLGAWLLLAAGTTVGPSVDGLLDPFATASASSASAGPDLLVVDVEGAVVRPGIIELPAGARVADALAAAGGYAPDADLAAAAAQVNLAALLRDGQQIVVPIIGAPSGSGATGDGGAGGGLVNLNSAGPDALDALPGIGPVTAQKIVAARAEQPFATLDELVTRKVMTSSQLDKIRDLVTLG